MIVIFFIKCIDLKFFFTLSALMNYLNTNVLNSFITVMKWNVMKCFVHFIQYKAWSYLITGFLSEIAAESKSDRTVQINHVHPLWKGTSGFTCSLAMNLFCIAAEVLVCGIALFVVWLLQIELYGRGIDCRPAKV